MDRMDHLEHLDKHLVDELAQVARETIRDELRQQTRKQRRKATLYAASGAVALYAGAAVALAVGLALALVLPGWAAALITAAILGVVAYLLRGAAHPHAAGTPHGRAELAAEQDRAHGAAPAAGPPGGLSNAPYPSVPPVPPTPPGQATEPTEAPGAGMPGPGEPPPGTLPRPDRIDPENPHHRA
ncbi:phage holin family protein [Streptomyces spinoverrucosus]|nr:phage holin family protein [Streptomyces spinoverrucosus]